MSDQYVIAWDLETVPDIDAVRCMKDMEGASDEQVREFLCSGFTKLGSSNYLVKSGDI